MPEQTQLDLPLLIIVSLLAATVIAFLMDVFPYPFGFFILCFALLGRILQLQSRK